MYLRAAGISDLEDVVARLKGYPRYNSAGRLERWTSSRRRYLMLRDPELPSWMPDVCSADEYIDAKSARAIVWMLEHGNAIIGDPPRVVHLTSEYIDDGYDVIERGQFAHIYYERFGSFLVEPSWVQANLHGASSIVTISPTSKWFSIGGDTGPLVFNLRTWGDAPVETLIKRKQVIYRACLDLGYECQSDRSHKEACESIVAPLDKAQYARFKKWLSKAPLN